MLQITNSRSYRCTKIPFDSNKMSESGDKHKPQICRLCLAQTVTYFSLIDDSESPAMLEALTSLRISPTDEISTVMCLKCRLNLKLAFAIQQNMLKAEQRFQECRLLVPIKKESDVDEALSVVETKFSEQESDDNGVLWDSSDFEEDDDENPDPGVSVKTETKKRTLEAACDVCGAVRSSKSSVKRHKLNCHGDKVQCPVCARHINPCHFKRHAELHEKRAEMVRDPEAKVGYPCSICGKVKLTRTTLTQHLSRHQHAKCWICYKDMPKEELKNHTVLCRQESEPKTHVCDVCGVSKATRVSLQRHKRTHVMGKCPVCSKDIKIENLKKHVALHTDDNVYKCEICGKIKPSKHSLNRHKTVVHNSDQSRCPICGLVMLEFNLKKHMERHNKTSFTMCELCGKSVYTPDIAVHMRHNHRDKSFKCKQCDQSFKKIHLLQKHRTKEHLGDPANYMCETCGRKFSSGGSLQKHVQSAHLKLRPHVCGVCNVGFSTPYSLKTHQRQHTNETPYKCEFCSEGFRQKVSLKTHLKSKHDVKEELTHECGTCGRKFESEFAVTAHARVHK